MKIFRFVLAVVVLNLTWIPIVSAEDNGRSLTLSAAVETVLERNPAIKMREAKIKASQSGLSEVRSMNWPSLSVRSSVTRGDNPVYVFGSLLEQQRFTSANFALDSLNNPDDTTNIKNALVVGVPVFTGLELQSQRKMGQLQLEQAQSELNGASQVARLQATNTYLEILLQRDVLKSIDERIASSQAELESARKLNAKGLVLGSDYYAAQAILSGLETQRTQVENGLRAAEDRLAILMGTSMDGQTLPAALSDQSYAVDPDEKLMARALAQRSDVKWAHQQANLAGVAYQQSGRSFWPKIDAFASMETNTEDFSSNPSNHMIGVRSEFPIGDPAYFSRRAKARGQKEEALNGQQSIEEKARIEVLQSLRQYQGAVASLPKAKETVEKAQKSLELFRPLYREGRQSIIDVLRAEEGLMRAQSAYLGTLFQLHAGYAQLQMASGALDDQAVARIDQQLKREDR